MESAIPEHLRSPRTVDARARADWNPPSPAFSARFPESVTSVVMAYVGVQYRGDRPASTTEALHRLRGAIAATDGPAHHDAARYVDTAGYTNDIAALYWLDQDIAEQWLSNLASWTANPETSDAGYFLEIATPHAADFETIFGGRRLEGIAALAENISDEITEHLYWGSMRDRLPSSQTSTLDPTGSLDFREDGDRTIVVPHDGIALIRSGQDWRDTEGAARERWLTDLRPKLQVGLGELATEGAKDGCYSMRLMQVTEDDGFVEKSYGHGWWHSLAELEEWAKSNRNHLAIFGAFGQFVREFNGAAGLRLYHEVSVLAADQVRFEYQACHPGTGLLAARQARITAS